MVKLIREISPKQMDWRNDPKVTRWLRQNHILGEYHQGEWLYNIGRDPEIEMFGIEAEVDSEGPVYKTKVNVGTCGLTGINKDHGTAEYSLLIGPEYQGNGFAKKALLKLLDHGFNNLRLNLIFGEVMMGNKGGSRLARRYLTFEAFLRWRYFKGGEYIGAEVYSVSADEWRNRNTD